MCILMDGTQSEIPAGCELISDNKISRVYFLQTSTVPLIYKRSIPYLIENERWALEQLKGQFAPRIKGLIDKYTLCIEYIDNQRIANPSKFMRECKSALKYFHNWGLRHGDLTVPHIRVINDSPVVIDWGESRVILDRRKDKRERDDYWWMWFSMNEILEKNGFEKVALNEW